MATRLARRRPKVVRNGWAIWYHPLFRDRFAALVAEVEDLAQQNPQGYRQHTATKLLPALTHIIETLVSAHPGAPQFRLGATLGVYTNWRRVKGNGLPSRYRLFFRFMIKAKVIVFVWLNDEDTQRKAGAKTDVYAVFRKMLQGGQVPDNFDVLFNVASAPP